MTTRKQARDIMRQYALSEHWSFCELINPSSKNFDIMIESLDCDSEDNPTIQVFELETKVVVCTHADEYGNLCEFDSLSGKNLWDIFHTVFNSTNKPVYMCSCYPRQVEDNYQAQFPVLCSHIDKSIRIGIAFVLGDNRYPVFYVTLDE